MPNAICKPYIVGIAGGTGAGKTTLAHKLFDHLGDDRAIRIAHDAYYRDFSHVPAGGAGKSISIIPMHSRQICWCNTFGHYLAGRLY